MNMFKIFPKEVLISEVDISVLKKTTIIAHLYYENHFNKNYEYLKRIDKNIDIYIITANAQIEKRFKEINVNKNIRVIRKPNRGRDFGALLVTAKDIVKRYEYVCFIHDKNGNELRTNHFAAMWEESFFECLIASDQYVKNIIDCFENDNNIGILSSPYPLDGVSLGFKGFTWTGNLYNSEVFLKSIGITTNINKYHDSMTIGSCFWFRYSALKKLYDYNFKYEDFPEEPMPTDFTIAHSLERVIDILSKDSSYNNYYVLNDKIASKYLDDYENDLRKTLFMLKKMQALIYDGVDLDLDKSISVLEDEMMFNNKVFNKIYILYENFDFSSINKLLFEYVKKGIVIDGFISIKDKNKAIFSNNNNYYICENNENVKKFIKNKSLQNYSMY